MAGEKSVKLHNKSDKPDNIILKEHEIVSKCEEIQEQLPDFLKGFFRYLKGDVLSKTRFAYLGDIHFFCRYLIEETDLTDATDPADIKKAEFNKIKASDINEFLDHCREYWVKQNGQDVLYQNGSRTLARKKSSLSVMFKQLYREGIMEKNITDGYKYVVDMDLERYFDTVNHNRLIQILSETIKDGRVISLIHKYLNAGVMSGGIFERSEEGVPQGGLCKA